MKSKSIHIKVTAQEHELLHKKAKETARTLSSYLRNMGLDLPLTSKVDQITLSELLKVKEDLGRMGGLLKMWLTNNDKKQATATLGSHSYFSIDHLVDDIEKKQEELLQIARRLL